MLLVDFIKEGVTALESIYPTAEAHSIIMILCESVLGTKNYTHIVDPGYVIAKAKIPSLQKDLERLKMGEPVQYVTGSTEFCGHSFKVTPDVLIPRPETELLVRQAIKLGSRIYRMRIPYGKNAEPVRVLDLCTGSGCIAWMIALSVPTAKVIAVDNSEAALNVARSQDFAAELKEKGAKAPLFLNVDVLDTEQQFDYGEFDMILSNPPYIMESEKSQIRKNVLDYEPSTALFVPNDNPLLYYKAIARWSNRFLSAEGFGISEINESLGSESDAVFREAGYTDTEILKDFYDKKRFIEYHR